MIRRATPADAEALSTLSRTCFTQTFGHLYAPADLAAFLDEAYSPTVLRAELEDPHRATWLLFEDPSDEAPASSRKRRRQAGRTSMMRKPFLDAYFEAWKPWPFSHVMSESAPRLRWTTR